MREKSMKKILLISGLIAGSFSFTAHADIYKCVGDSGIPAFVDGKTKTEGNYKNCVLFIRDDSASGRSNTSGGSKAGRQSQTKTATPADFPRVDRQTQDQRDGKRKEILQQELSAKSETIPTWVLFSKILCLDCSQNHRKIFYQFPITGEQNRDPKSTL